MNSDVYAFFMLLHDFKDSSWGSALQKYTGIDMSEFEMCHFVTYEIISLIAVKFGVMCVEMSGEF